MRLVTPAESSKAFLSHLLWHRRRGRRRIAGSGGRRRREPRPAHRQHRTEGVMPYHLEGRLLEVCNCRVLCPCWIGEDPDNGTCDTIVAWHFDKGSVEGVDVAGCTIAC